jgi:hypothetical protein
VAMPGTNPSMISRALWTIENAARPRTRQVTSRDILSGRGLLATVSLGPAFAPPGRPIRQGSPNQAASEILPIDDT